MRRNRIAKKSIWVIALVIIAAAIIISISPVYDSLIAKVHQITSSDLIVIDPGHGGMDGGASSDAGVTEKEINLSIAFYIRELAEADGWKVAMTREEDKGLGDSVSKTIRSKKTADLIARRDMIRDIKPTVAVSIHLNSFKQDRSVRGAQAFYPVGSGEQSIIEESKKLAEIIQEQLVSGIADGSDRTALGKRDVLMFKNPVVPMVIVECGFLSNPEEAKLLEQEEYQRKLAKCIYEGILLYTGREPREPVQAIDSRG
ncbi:MAG: N-acetylmuramoyl-L-alanine amidase [Eubacteriales bacterium]|nr:N-acetylmuramoyl-L-alanine amidase [Eubacteriales bacterium]